MLKKIIFLLLLLVLIKFPAQADSVIGIRENLRNFVSDIPSGPPFWIDTELGKTESELINSYILQGWKSYPSYTKFEENINNQYKLFMLKEEAGISVVYVINKNTGKVNGYFILEDVSGMTVNLYNSIKNMNINNIYLENQIIQTEKATIKFYEKYHSENDFIERYAIMTTKDGEGIKTESLIIDSYYPSFLDEFIAPKFVRTINNILDWENRYWNGEELPIEFRY